jgi:hypothetical protein
VEPQTTAADPSPLLPQDGVLGPIAIEKLWNGRTATDRERALLSLRAEGEALRLTVDASFHGDPAPAGPVGPTDGLWEHEVVELFIAGADGSYLEVEVGPYGHHLALRLRGVRDVVERGMQMRCRTVITRGLWSADCWIPRAWLPPGPHRLNACAIHGVKKGRPLIGDGRRYLSWVALPGAAPDFHQPALFRPVVLPGA